VIYENSFPLVVKSMGMSCQPVHSSSIKADIYISDCSSATEKILLYMMVRGARWTGDPGSIS